MGEKIQIPGSRESSKGNGRKYLKYINTKIFSIEFVTLQDRKKGKGLNSKTKTKRVYQHLAAQEVSKGLL